MSYSVPSSTLRDSTLLHQTTPDHTRPPQSHLPSDVHPFPASEPQPWTFFHHHSIRNAASYHRHHHQHPPARRPICARHLCLARHPLFCRRLLYNRSLYSYLGHWVCLFFFSLSFPDTTSHQFQTRRLYRICPWTSPYAFCCYILILAAIVYLKLQSRTQHNRPVISANTFAGTTAPLLGPVT